MGKYNVRFGGRFCQIRINLFPDGEIDLSAHVNPVGATEYPDTSEEYPDAPDEAVHLSALKRYLAEIYGPENLVNHTPAN